MTRCYTTSRQIHLRLAARDESGFARPQVQFSMPVLATIPASDAMRAARVTAAPDDPANSILQRLRDSRLPGAPVVARGGELRGVVSLSELERAKPDALVAALLHPDARQPTAITTDDSLDEALGTMANNQVSWAPVVSEGKLVGVLSVQDAMRSYRSALAGSARRIRSLGPGGSLVRAMVDPRSGIAGRSVAKVPWPRDVVLVAVHRGEQLIVPRGDLRLESGDQLTLFLVSAARQALEELLQSSVQEEARRAETLLRRLLMLVLDEPGALTIAGHCDRCYCSQSTDP